jgi:membrane protease subunit (stomatin/prohibitin family)
MGDVQLGWNNIDTLLTLNVTFNYTDFSITNINDSQLADDISSLSSIQRQVGLSSSVLNNASISYPQNVVDLLNVNSAKTAFAAVPNYAGGASSISSTIAQSIFGV